MSSEPTADEMFLKLGFRKLPDNSHKRDSDGFTVSYFAKGKISWSDKYYGQRIWDKDLLLAMLKLSEENEDLL